MTAYINYPLTTSDDDEFFDAPAGSVLILCDAEFIEESRYVKIDDAWGWQAPDGSHLRTGELWSSLFADGNPYGDHGLRPNSVLRITQEWANHYDLCEGGREAAEARAEARVAAWMGSAA